LHDEELDVWLAQECDLAISTASGWDVLPVAFGRPLAFIDVGEEFFWGPSIAEPRILVPKRIVEIDSGREVRASDLARSAASGHEIWRDLQSSAPVRFQIQGLTDIEIQESVELGLQMLQRPSDEPWQLRQTAEIRRFWTDQLVPLGYRVPKLIPSIPQDFFERNRSWLIR
jgi:putative glycosyltransferase (TIGR04372 family)